MSFLVVRGYSGTFRNIPYFITINVINGNYTRVYSTHRHICNKLPLTQRKAYTLLIPPLPLLVGINQIPT